MSIEGSPLALILNNPTMVMLGRASYALYILQLPVHKFMTLAIGDSLGLFGKLLYLPTMVVLSIIVFHVYEERMQQWIRGGVPTPQRPSPSPG